MRFREAFFRPDEEVPPLRYLSIRECESVFFGQPEESPIHLVLLLLVMIMEPGSQTERNVEAPVRAERPQPGSLLHKAFKIGIGLKGIDGVLELAGGALLWIEKRVALNHVVKALTQHELSEDPHDFVANHLVQAVRHFGHSEKAFAALYLGLHGVVKIVLVGALWRNKLWAYPIMIAVLLGFIGYQIYRMTLTPTVFLGALTVIDVGIVWLTWMEYRHQKRGHE